MSSSIITFQGLMKISLWYWTAQLLLFCALFKDIIEHLYTFVPLYNVFYSHNVTISTSFYLFLLWIY